MKLFSNMGINTIVKELNKCNVIFEFDSSDNCIIKLDNDDEIVLWSTGHPTMDPTKGFFNIRSIDLVKGILPFMWAADQDAADSDETAWKLLCVL